MAPTRTPTSDIPSLHVYLSCTSEDFRRSSAIILRIFDNITTHGASDAKHRRINISSNTFVSNVLPINGALELLFEVGFEEDPSSNEHLILPANAPLDPLVLCRDVIQKESHRRTEAMARQDTPKESLNTPQRPTSEPQQAPPLYCGTRPTSRHDRKDVEERRHMYSLMISLLRQVAQYEDPNLIEAVKKAVPVVRLSEEAKELASNSEDGHGVRESQEAMVRSCFLYLLLKWFKADFFKWVNNAPCDYCNGETEPTQPGTPTPEEKRFGAERVEMFQCKTCRRLTRFPRFNAPIKLLETRRGRCGEWANCFTAVCRAMGYDARFVVDNADHVWTEVYSELENRWLHCDSCEAALDKPLTYEIGWGKKLAYVFAVSPYEVVDVSWRYSADHLEMCRRRLIVSEKWLGATIEKVNGKLLERFPSQRQTDLRRRRWLELLELATPKTAKESEKIGRVSGSLIWRLSRGEAGQRPADILDPYILIPTAEELSRKMIRVCYESVKDRYIREAEEIPGFRTLTFRCENISRKVEQDWQMSYLCRSQGASLATIAWKFDWSSTGASPQSLRTRIPCDVYHSGRVTVSITADDHVISQEAPSDFTHVFSGTEKSVIIEAVLTAGEGENSWQHTQLFRESLSGNDSNPVLFEMRFN